MRWIPCVLKHLISLYCRGRGTGTLFGTLPTTVFIFVKISPIALIRVGSNFTLSEDKPV